MAKFGVNIVKIRALEAIPGADAIELAVVGDYRSVVRKAAHRVGELVAYVPEAAIVPEWLLKAMGLEGKLAGSEKNRVKAIKLRGCLSQGIVLGLGRYRTDWYVDEGETRYLARRPKVGTPEDTFPTWCDEQEVKAGDDIADFLGITKWEPIVPASMSGEVYAAGQHLTVPYDIENFKKFPDVLVEGEEVVFTEKLHGTFCGVGILPPEFEDPKHIKGKFVVFSKGLGAQGMCFRDVHANESNVYMRALTKRGVFDKLEALRADMMDDNDGDFSRPLYLLGEVFGGSIQDAGWYSKDIDFRIFDVVSGFRGDHSYFSIDAKQFVAAHLGLETVPYLYRGPFSKEVMLQYTSGKETVSGKELNMREGIVVTPVNERRDGGELGRVILKSVSEAYLLRKNGTEFS